MAARLIIVRQNSVDYAATMFVSLFSWGTNRAAKEMYNQSRKLCRKYYSSSLNIILDVTL